jgi:DNA-binding NarL/FixJ family response regulator
VVIAEDLFLLRDGLTRMLEAHGPQIAAAVDNGPDLVAAVSAQQPDVAIVDVRLPPTFTDVGLRAALAARREVPGLPVLVLSQYVEQLYARELLAGGTGGIGYLLKDRVLDSAQFVDAVRRVAAGGTAMDPEVIARLLARNTWRLMYVEDRTVAEVADRWLPYLRLGAAIALTATAVGALAAGAAAARLPGGTLDVLRNVAALAGIGLLSAALLGGALAWIGPMTYLLIAEYGLTVHWTTPWTWPARPPHDLGAALCAALAFAVGVAVIAVRGARESARE